MPSSKILRISKHMMNVVLNSFSSIIILIFLGWSDRTEHFININLSILLGIYFGIKVLNFLLTFSFNYIKVKFTLQCKCPYIEYQVYAASTTNSNKRMINGWSGNHTERCSHQPHVPWLGYVTTRKTESQVSCLLKWPIRQFTGLQSQWMLQQQTKAALEGMCLITLLKTKKNTATGTVSSLFIVCNIHTVPSIKHLAILPLLASFKFNTYQLMKIMIMTIPSAENDHTLNDASVYFLLHK